MSINRTALSFLFTIIFLNAGVAYGQLPPANTTATAGWTPLAQQPGAPAGSYPLSGFDNINLFNGHVNFRLPLKQISGRGRAGYMITLPIEQNWIVQTVPVPTCDQSGCTYHESNYRYIANPIWWTGLRPGFGPGVLQGRQAGDDVASVTGCSGGVYASTLTRLTFTGPDGTEIELRDTQSGGQPSTGTPPSQQNCFDGVVRGRVFASADGSATTFISDSPISDVRQPGGGPHIVSPSGYLMFRDGTRYRIVNGQTTEIRDSNGNKVTFNYTDGVLTSIDDSLNRRVSISPGIISFKGSNGEPRTVKVYSGALSSALRKHADGSPEYTIKTFAQLFPSLQNPQQGNCDISVTTGVELPDGRSYQFRYDSYGNLAQVILPTGGRIEYDWTTGTYQFGDHVFGIYTRVIERRTAVDTTTAVYETRTTYSTPVNGVVTVDNLDPKNGNALLSRSKHYFYGNWMPNLNAKATDYPAWQDGREYQTEEYAADGTTVLKRTNRMWEQRGNISWWTGSATNSPQNDPRMVDTTTTLMDTTPNLVSRRTSIDPNNTAIIGFDQYNNQTDVWEYDFGSSTPTTHTQTTYLTSGYDTLNPSSSAPNLSLTYHIRSLPTRVSTYEVTGSTEIERARTTIEYDNYSGSSCSTSNHCPLAPRSNISGFDSAFGTSYTNRGNVTGVSRFLLTNGSVSGSISSYSFYDIAGNVVTTIDARGFRHNLTFDDCFGAQDGNARLPTTQTELNSVGQMSYAFPTKMTNPLGHESFAQFDYYLGQPIEVEDPNGVVTSAYFDDDLDRPTKLISAANKDVSLKGQTTFEYLDTANTIITRSDLNSFNDSSPTKRETLYDGLGRTTETRQYESASAFVAILTEYDGGGRPFKTSNPYRSGETIRWTIREYDALGRIKSVATPDNAVVNTFYDGPRTLMRDQAGRERLSVTNAFGQLKEVWEITAPDPATEAVNFPGRSEVTAGYRTNYAYDALNNLVTVTQRVGTAGTLQTRSFVYDSLSRLTSETQPESGTVSYKFDENGNLVVKTDARTDPNNSSKKVSTHFAYDGLNRITRRWYNGSSSESDTINNSPTLPPGVAATAEAKYIYDSTALPSLSPGVPSFSRGSSLGRLVAVTYGAGSSAGTYYGYDEIGRPILKIQQIGDKNYDLTAQYNAAGVIKSVKYPSDHIVNYGFDGAGRLNNFSGDLGDGTPRTYSSEVIYSPFGGIAKEKFGTATAIYNKLFYNWRGQLAEVRTSTSYTGPTDDTWNRGAIVNNYSASCTTTEGAACNGSDNNGNVIKQKLYVPSNDQLPTTSFTLRTQEFNYDSLNRISWAREVLSSNEQWRQEFAYDRFGNRTINTNSAATHDTGTDIKAFHVDLTRNQLLPSGQPGSVVMTYDAAGNLTNDNYTGNGSRVYDAENRMTSAMGNNSQPETYVYDGSSQRVRRTASQVETWQVYGFNGELVAEYPANATKFNPTKEYGYRNGNMLISAESGNAFAPPIFSDNFDDNSLNTNSWTIYYPGAPVVSEQSQRLQIALQANTAAYNGVYSNSTYDLTGRMVQMEAPQTVSQAGWCENVMELELNTNNYFMIQTGGGNLLLRSRVNGVNDQTTIPFDAGAHRFWRVRHDQNGNVIHFETSAEDAVWITRKSVTAGFSITSLRIHMVAGCYGTGNSNPGTVKYDNVKLLASTGGATSLTVPNGGFESPVMGNGNFQYAPSGGSWAFANGGGISGMNSGFTGSGSVAGDGMQIAFLQATGEASQSISGFQANTNYVISFKAMQRTNCCNTGGQDIGVYLDTTLIASFHPGSADYFEYSTPTFSTTAGTHTLKFKGLNPLGGDHTAFIDGVRITGSPKPGYGVQWMVTDHLGTPRIVLDQSGTLASVRRHDYLPFGEEIPVGVGGRSGGPNGQGFGNGDGVRQQFTAQERDIETKLDYFGARYSSTAQGDSFRPIHYCRPAVLRPRRRGTVTATH
jgi:YD repeat-containing protein